MQEHEKVTGTRLTAPTVETAAAIGGWMKVDSSECDLVAELMIFGASVCGVEDGTAVL